MTGPEAATLLTALAAVVGGLGAWWNQRHKPRVDRRAATDSEQRTISEIRGADIDGLRKIIESLREEVQSLERRVERAERRADDAEAAAERTERRALIAERRAEEAEAARLAVEQYNALLRERWEGPNPPPPPPPYIAPTMSPWNSPKGHSHPPEGSHNE